MGRQPIKTVFNVAGAVFFDILLRNGAIYRHFRNMSAIFP